MHYGVLIYEGPLDEKLLEKPYARAVHWMYAIELDEECEISAETMVDLLKERHIGARPFLVLRHNQFLPAWDCSKREPQTPTGLTSVGCICRLGMP